MRKLKLLPAGLMLCMLCLAPAQVLAQGGLLTDYSFETTDLTGNGGWTLIGNTQEAYTASLSSTVSYNGSKSLYFPSAISWNISYVRSDTMPVLPSTAYSAAIDVYDTVTALAEAGLRMVWYDSGMNYLSSDNNMSGISAQSVWHRFKLENVTSPSNAAYCALEIDATNMELVGTVHLFVDCATFVQATTAVENWKTIKER